MFGTKRLVLTKISILTYFSCDCEYDTGIKITTVQINKKKRNKTIHI